MPIPSLAAEDWQEYRHLLNAAAAEETVDVVELNLSCPNVERGGMAIGADPELLRRYVQLACDVLRGTAILAKLTPNVADIASLALAAEEAGADGITAINTVVGAEFDPTDGKPVFNRIRAGLSGPAILPIALEAIWRISRVVDIPVIGVGGISSVEDARKFFMAGASAVQIGTAIFCDPTLPEAVVDSLEREGVPRPGTERSRDGA
jgi:dihydroorotate dehydrogenase (NAD+) catalytic subunit